jgi:hypothetical protein
MEQLDYNLLFRWFVGLNMDDAVWAPVRFPRTGSDSWKVISPRVFSRECCSRRGKGIGGLGGLIHLDMQPETCNPNC